MVDEDTMLVRLESGDVVRRPVAHRSYLYGEDGRKHLAQEEPVLAADEVAVRSLSERIPRIIKAR